MKASRRGVEVRGQVVVGEAGVVLFGRRVPESVKIDVGGALELRVPPQGRSFRPEALEVEIGVKEVGALERTSRGGAKPKTLLPEIRLTIAQPGGEPLTRSHASKHDLGTVDAAPGIQTFLETALDQTVDRVHDRRLAFRPELGYLVGPLVLYSLGPRARRLGARLLRECCSREKQTG